jgi:multiple antibiotic resistance protein
MSFWTASVTLFLLLDPVGNIPVFHALLEKHPPRIRIRLILRELFVALGVLLVFLHAGRHLLDFLGLKPASLGITGGLILFLIAIRMVFPEKLRELEPEDEEPFIVPLAIPLIAGPSVIAMLLLLSSAEPHRMIEWTLALVLSWTLSALVLVTSPFLLAVLHPRGIRALVRLMGMILVMLGVQMFMDGIIAFLNS